MRATRLAAGFLAVICIVAATGCGGEDEPGKANAPAHAEPEWSYAGADGPERWAELDPEFALCETGRTQSPIDIVGARPGTPPAIEVDYSPENVILENNGHAIEAAFENPRSSITIGDDEYRLTQFHVHTPAEELIGGRSFDASIHLVHLNESGAAAVLGLLVETGRPDPLFGRLTHAMPLAPGGEVHVAGRIDPGHLIRNGGPVFRHTGSLTTPPCTEGVDWTVYKRPITMSKKQLRAFQLAYPDNSRPVQPRNGRPINLAPPPA